MDRKKRKPFHDRRPEDIERVCGIQQGRGCTEHLQEDAKTEQYNESADAMFPSSHASHLTCLMQFRQLRLGCIALQRWSSHHQY